MDGSQDSQDSQDNQDNQDVQQFGTAQVVFPTQASSSISVITSASTTISSATSTSTPTTSASTTVSIAKPTSSSASQPSATSGHTPTRNKAIGPIVAVSIFSAFILFAIIVMLIRFFNRRRLKSKRRTFDQERMVQNRPPPPSMAQRFAPHSQDLEQGVTDSAPVVLPISRPTRDPELGRSEPIVHPTSLVAGPRGPRPSLRRLELHSPRPRLPTLPATPRTPSSYRPSLPRSPGVTPSRIAISPGPIRSPIPRSPSPRTHRQRAIADQIEMLRIQMLQYERAGRNDGSDAMNEMTKKMAWLREQQEGSWALGLTEVTPLGYDRYMT